MNEEHIAGIKARLDELQQFWSQLSDDEVPSYLDHALIDIADLLAERERLREALSWYAEVNHYQDPTGDGDYIAPGIWKAMPSSADPYDGEPIYDRGQRARAALGVERGE